MIKYYFYYVYLYITRFILSVCQMNCCHYATEVIYDHQIWRCKKIRHMDDHILVEIKRLNRKTGGFDSLEVDQNDLIIRLTLSNVVYNALYWFREYKQKYISADASHLANRNIMYSYLTLGKRRALGLDYERI